MHYLFRILAGLVLVPYGSLAQSRPVILRGALDVEGGERFTYKLVISETDSGRFTGTAYTWLKEENDTRALVSGTIDRQRKVLSFDETEIEYNHHFESKAVLCLLQARLGFKSGNNGITLEGPVTSTDHAAASCSKGSLVFTTEDVIRSLFAAPAPRPITAAAQPGLSRPVKTSDPVSEGPPKIVKDLQKITKNVEKIFEWSADYILLEIWDGGSNDGDVISVGFNGMPVLNHYPLSGEKRLLRLNCSGKDEDEITIIAEQEGMEPLTTAHILLTDGNIQYPVIAYNKAGKKATMRIRRKTGK